MATKEPKIFADGLTNEEVHHWMALKVSAGRQLQGALAEKAELQQALKHLDQRISELTSSAALVWLSTDQDPTLHP
ncbi:hypothetical protein ABKV42_02170 [Enterobacter roggenkampii]|uniref:hypothetical protein n=1 Tax=Enterobacter roggenkampii TaxID=1812935 RepID=UPI0032AEE615